ncbi:uncharacterized protein FIBRA_08187 [Fibroporia radiculosa]|uniref:GPI ethanolamine phosphate transferase 1 n=1 Tax=Fibroporia radiculosa TaxID=599839 RepID=J4GGR7_9APHY|nr:uncharacterized protein FIBRA_08187 [Fibroporia radiculosa]CCM05948.1 predicted protein [Fibroporia radiculosa]
MGERRPPILRLLLVGLVFHLVYIGTVFDCYFTSPVVHGMQPFRLEHAEAKRLVLIVADGLRADLLLALNAFPSIPGAPEVVAPHIRSIIQTRGAFGISHTRVPTESRPGHVALIGGMYEDVSAVTKGWKTNPVDFDSVFNRSSHTFSFGSPDILPMFARGATLGKVDMWCYDEDEEDFTKDATALDVWVLDHLRTLFHNATGDAALDHTLKQDKTVFFLHLLGLDTTGHSYRPHSPEYMANIQVVDEIVKQTEQLFSDFYGDEETSFIFTADHGMSKIGNHGDGDPDSTRTPLVTWGKGIRGPLPDSVPSSHDSYSEAWGLTHLFRRDVAQADVSVLMTSLIGVDWPVNSVGVLPDVDVVRPGYLNLKGGETSQAEAALINTKVILEHYRVKHEQKKAHTLLYQPFPFFLNSSASSPGIELLTEIEHLIAGGELSKARSTAADLIRSTLDGLRYLETYDRTLIRAIVTAAYLGWIAFGSVSIFATRDVHSAEESTRTAGLDVVGTLTLLLFWGLFALQRSPWTFYLYICFPVYFWHQTARYAVMSFTGHFMNKGSGLWTILKLFVQGCMVVGALGSMVIGYTHREIWSVWFIVLGIVWPIVSWPSEARFQHFTKLLPWSTVCLATAVFPMLSVDKEEDITAVLVGGILMVMVGVLGAFELSVDKQIRRSFRTAIGFQCLLICASMVITASSASSLRAKAGLPLLNQVLGWIVFLIASTSPFIVKLPGLNPLGRILMFFLGFSVCFVILSISVEGLFYFFFSATLLLWVEVEAIVRGAERNFPSKELRGYKIRADDLRIAIFFLFFVQVAFFGTGNVASISSFYLEPVYRLVPVFNPFLMAVLLVGAFYRCPAFGSTTIFDILSQIFKIIAPYIILATSLHLLNRRLHLPPFSLFLVALTLTDVMTMTFFFKVTDTGSWLEIGQSISFFCISSLLLVWAAGTCAVGELLMADSLDASAETARKVD